MTSTLITMFTILMSATSTVALTPESPDTKPSEEKKIELPTIPKVALALVEGFADTQSYEQSLADRLGLIKHRIGETKDVPLRAKLLLAEANLILAYHLEPVCTTAMLHIDSSATDIQSYFERADHALDEAQQALDLQKDSQDNQDETTTEDIHQSRQSLNILRAFAQAQRVYLLREGDDREARRAATGLSALVENDNAQIKSAALLWQGCLRGREEDPSSALSRLDFALQNVSKSTLPFSFYSRLLRCRIYLDHGSYAMTLSLLIQMEEHSRDWVLDADSLKHSSQIISLMRMQTLREWYEHLDENTQEAQRRWCAAQMQELIESRFDGDPKPVMRLLPAVPMVAPVPE